MRVDAERCLRAFFCMSEITELSLEEDNELLQEGTVYNDASSGEGDIDVAELIGETVIADYGEGKFNRHKNNQKIARHICFAYSDNTSGGCLLLVPVNIETNIN